MFKHKDPRDLAVALLSRSGCQVQVAAVLEDFFGIFSWGWNSPGSGFGEHAEAACMRRSNRERVRNATIYIAARRAKNGNTVTARPCAECFRKIRQVRRISYRDERGLWRDY